MKTPLLVAVSLSLVVMSSCVQLEVMNEWNLFEWTRSSSDYRPNRAVPVSLEVTEDRVFIAIPRLFSGLPASLAVIPRNRPGHAVLNPPLTAWPSDAWHSGHSNCSETLVSVFRMRLDSCNRLWVLDCGVKDSFETFTVQCPPKVLIFDLHTDQLISRILISEELLRRNSLVTNLVIDEESTGFRCDRLPRVYLSDSSSPAVFVYEPRHNSMWRFQHPYMYPDPNHGEYTVEGESFTLMDGILGLSLSPPGQRPKRLYFQPFASDGIFSVETAYLDQGPNQADDSQLPVRLEAKKSSQAAGMVANPRDGSIYFSPVSEEAIVSWIPGTTNARRVANNRELMQFVLDLRSVPSDSYNIWFISTKMQKFVKQSLESGRPHIRIVRILPDHEATLNNTIY